MSPRAILEWTLASAVVFLVAWFIVIVIVSTIRTWKKDR